MPTSMESLAASAFQPRPDPRCDRFDTPAADDVMPQPATLDPKARNTHFQAVTYGVWMFRQSETR